MNALNRLIVVLLLLLIVVATALVVIVPQETFDVVAATFGWLSDGVEGYRQSSDRLLFAAGRVLAGGPIMAQTTPGQIVITGADASSAPAIQLHIYAIDGQGNPAQLDPGALKVEHNGVAVSDDFPGQVMTFPGPARHLSNESIDVDRPIGPQLLQLITIIYEIAAYSRHCP